MAKKNQILIKDKDKIFKSFTSKTWAWYPNLDLWRVQFIKDLSTIPQFLLFLLALLFGQPCFYFDRFFKIFGQAINKTKSMNKKVAISFSKYSL